MKEKSVEKLRDYGYPDTEVTGAPTVVRQEPGGVCPNCQCASIFSIDIGVSNPSPMLRRPEEPHRVVGRYLGCPACPWASPAVITVERLRE